MKHRFARIRLAVWATVALIGAACAARVVAEVPPEARARPPLEPGEAVVLYQQARKTLIPVDTAYQKALAASLESQNKYERRLALDRLSDLRAPLDPSLLAPLVKLLPETEKLHDEHCTHLIDRLSRSYGGQGEELEYARCNVRRGTSNGSLAARLLMRFAGTGKVQPAIAAHVRAHPADVEAVIDSLGPQARGVGRAAVEALGTSRDSQTQKALLRLAQAGGCGELDDPSALEPVARLLDSKEVGLAAALALLRLSACEREKQELAAAHAQATQIVQARLADHGDKDIVTQVTRLGKAAARFAAELQKRYQANRGERPALIEAYGAMRDRGAGAVPWLVSVLTDAESSDLHGVALEALARIGPPSAVAKRAVLALLWDKESPYRTEALEALAYGSAKLGPGEFKRLEAVYQVDCADAGSIPFFNLDRDAKCEKQSQALSLIAENAGLPFRAEDGQR